jgi:hypothetical protein
LGTVLPARSASLAQPDSSLDQQLLLRRRLQYGPVHVGLAGFQPVSQRWLSLYCSSLLPTVLYSLVLADWLTIVGTID